jgi:hypothetical protein
MRKLTLSALVFLALPVGCVFKGGLPMTFRSSGVASMQVSGGAAVAPVATTTVASASSNASIGMQVNTPNGAVGMDVSAGPNGASMGVRAPGASVSMGATGGPNGAAVGVNATGPHGEAVAVSAGAEAE